MHVVPFRRRLQRLGELPSCCYAALDRALPLLEEFALAQPDDLNRGPRRDWYLPSRCCRLPASSLSIRGRDALCLERVRRSTDLPAPATASRKATPQPDERVHEHEAEEDLVAGVVEDARERVVGAYIDATPGWVFEGDADVPRVWCGVNGSGDSSGEGCIVPTINYLMKQLLR